MNIHTTITILVAAGAVTTSGAQVILNGDLNGTVGAGNIPTNWFAWSGSADTCDTTGPFNSTGNPWVLSPNGGTFVRGGSTGTGVNEAIAQDLTGFTAGQAYTIEYYITNLGFNSSTWNGADGYFKMFIDGTDVGDTAVLSKQILATDDIVWEFGTVSFVAPADDFELAVASYWAGGPGTAAYMGIDGINIRPVPAPASIGLLGMGGLIAARRRR